MVKMGSDIDDKKNHRIRGIIPVDNGDYIFLEISQAYSPKKDYLHDLSQEKYKKKFPYENYLFVEDCYRVDVPKDKFNYHSEAYKNFDKKAFYTIEYTPKNILKLCSTFNKKIVDVKLVEENYIKEFEEEMGFYDLYNDKLNHTIKPIEILRMDKSIIKFKMHYHCTNYNNTIDYDEIYIDSFNNDIDSLKKEYGAETIETLIENYNNELIYQK